MKQNLQLKLSQHLALTPQLQQSIRLLQLSTLELDQELEQILQENPLLERDTDADASHTASENSETPETATSAEAESLPADASDLDTARLDDLDWNDYGERPSEDEDEMAPQGPVGGPSLREHLLGQLSMLSRMPERDRALILALIDDLNDDGYLAHPLEDLLASLEDEITVELEELEIALQHLQHFDPTGVGARTPAECLRLQLLAMPPHTPGRRIALEIVTHHLTLLANRDVGKLKKLLGIDDLELRVARQLITRLNPRPGAAFGEGDIHYVIPDVVVRKIKGQWVASLNSDAMPKLRINRVYADILSRNRDNGGSALSSQLQEAKWLIKNVQQRFDTILRVSQAILDRQRNFLEHGDVAMRPLVLREIADVVGLHESTISRVTTQKYMMTPRGLYELKYFFGSHVSTDTGGACSSTAIRALIKQMVGEENNKKPLSDGQIADVLGKQGIMVARRTIAKYRESMQIPPANLRKSL
jgi:RNA polymerase sigma-54 factor